MKLGTRSRQPSMEDRLIWQCAAILLSYPGEQGPVDELLAHIRGKPANQMGRMAAALKATDLLRAQADYVGTFDQQRRCTMYLTYWTAGDTRNRGAAMLAFATAYRDAGVQPPTDEAPDFLPVVLEFAAIVDPATGQRLLAEHRVAIGVLHQALTETESPYADVVAAVLQTLPNATDHDTRQVDLLARAGPPTESVGLQPFTLTVPPRRAQGG
jgi:nitrate reductase molybdenum cofactor assembly chaperone NarJ/NarW